MYENITILYILLFLIFSYITSHFLIRQYLIGSTSFSMKKSERLSNDRWGDSNKSHLGGIAFSCCAIISFLMIISQNTFVIGEITEEYKSFIGLFFIVIISSIVGVLDEKENMKPLTKLFFQFIISGVIIWAGYVIPLTELFIANVLFTLFWLILFINALNMFDNVDGAAGIFSLSIFLLFLFMALSKGSNLDLIIIISVYVGSIAAFLYYNIYPSKLFMGDIGSLQLASILGAISIKVFWKDINQDLNIYDLFYNLLLNNLVFLVIFFDVLFVFALRISKGKNPFIGDTNHLSHAVIKIVKNPKMAIYLLSAFTAINIITFLIFSLVLSEYSIVFKLITILLFILTSFLLIFYLFRKGINLNRV